MKKTISVELTKEQVERILFWEHVCYTFDLTLSRDSVDTNTVTLFEEKLAELTSEVQVLEAFDNMAKNVIPNPRVSAVYPKEINEVCPLVKEIKEKK